MTSTPYLILGALLLVAGALVLALFVVRSIRRRNQEHATLVERLRAQIRAANAETAALAAAPFIDESTEDVRAAAAAAFADMAPAKGTAPAPASILLPARDLPDHGEIAITREVPQMHPDEIQFPTFDPRETLTLDRDPFNPAKGAQLAVWHHFRPGVDPMALASTRVTWSTLRQIQVRVAQLLGDGRNCPATYAEDGAQCALVIDHRAWHVTRDGRAWSGPDTHPDAPSPAEQVRALLRRPRHAPLTADVSPEELIERAALRPDPPVRLVDELPAEPPAVRLVEPGPITDPALTEGGIYDYPPYLPALSSEPVNPDLYRGDAEKTFDVEQDEDGPDCDCPPGVCKLDPLDDELQESATEQSA